MSNGQESPSVKREDGDIMVSRTIRTPSGSIVITGTLTEADRIYRLLLKSLLQNGYSSHHLTKTERAQHGNVLDPPPPPPPDSTQITIDRLVDENIDLIKSNRALSETITTRDREIARLQNDFASLETVLNNVTRRTD